MRSMYGGWSTNNLTQLFKKTTIKSKTTTTDNKEATTTNAASNGSISSIDSSTHSISEWKTQSVHAGSGGIWGAMKEEEYNPTIEWMKLESTKVVKKIEPKQLLLKPSTVTPTTSTSNHFKGKDSSASSSVSSSTKKDYIRFVCISDTHGMQANDMEIPDGDVLIHAGDFTQTGELKEIQKLDQLLSRLPHKHKIVIAGNHDITFHKGWYEKNFTRFHSSMESVSKCRGMLKNAIYLEDESIHIEGYKIYGSPWTPEFCHWAFNVKRGAKSKAKWENIPKDTEILITHGPPLGYGDNIYRSNERVGCLDLLNVVEQIKPLYHIFGHIHEDYGITTNGHTKFINASTCTVGYKPVNKPIVFDLPIKDISSSSSSDDDNELDGPISV